MYLSRSLLSSEMLSRWRDPHLLANLKDNMLTLAQVTVSSRMSANLYQPTLAEL